MGSPEYGALSAIWMDHWYMECCMRSISCSRVLGSSSKIYKHRYILERIANRAYYGFFLKLDILPHATHLLWINLLILLSGIVITGIGGGMYVAAGIGAGPRDGFMLAISDKTGLSVSRARITVESFVLVIGYILGGPVFIVTFLYTFIQSPIFQRSFKGFQELLYTLEGKKKENIRASL